MTVDAYDCLVRNPAGPSIAFEPVHGSYEPVRWADPDRPAQMHVDVVMPDLADAHRRILDRGAEELMETDDEWGDGLYLGTFVILSLLESADSMALIARGVFDRDACRRLLDDLQTFVVDVLADPSCRIPVASTAEPGDDVVEVRGLRGRVPASRADSVPGPGWPPRRRGHVH